MAKEKRLPDHHVPSSDSPHIDYWTRLLTELRRVSTEQVYVHAKSRSSQSWLTVPRPISTAKQHCASPLPENMATAGTAQ
jgi:hypothetical protein